MGSLESYKGLNALQKNYITDFMAYRSIEWVALENGKTATDEEMGFIKTICEDAYLKDEEGYSITKFVDFVANNYFNRNLTREDLERASKWDIISATIDDNYEMLKEKNIER